MPERYHHGRSPGVLIGGRAAVDGDAAVDARGIRHDDADLRAARAAAGVPIDVGTAWRAARALVHRLKRRAVHAACASEAARAARALAATARVRAAALLEAVAERAAARPECGLEAIRVAVDGRAGDQVQRPRRQVEAADHGDSHAVVDSQIIDSGGDVGHLAAAAF